MTAKEAIACAKALVQEFYAEETLSDIRLEEVEFEEASDSWLITLGILRPAEAAKSRFVDEAIHLEPLRRDYKIMRVSNSVTTPPSMKIREFHSDE